MRFYTLIIIYLASISAVLLTVDSTRLSYILVATLSIILLVLVVIGVSTMKLNLFISSVSTINPGKREVALTFDDGPDAELTTQIIELLRKYEAKATFFCIGYKIKGHEGLLRQMYNEGHVIGNHTYEHSVLFPLWSVSKIKQSIDRTDELIEQITGKRPVLFRPPFGVLNNFIALVLRRMGGRCVGWSIRTKDTCRTPERVMQIVKRNIRPGSIVLFHDTNINIISILEQTLIYCKQNNLKAVALS